MRKMVCIIIAVVYVMGLSNGYGIKREIDNRKEIVVETESEQNDYVSKGHSIGHTAVLRNEIISYEDSEGRLVSLVEKRTIHKGIHWNEENMVFKPEEDYERESEIYVNGELIDTEEKLYELDHPEAVLEVLNAWAE